MPDAPHLLVVGAGNSYDLGPVRLRHEAKRGGTAAAAARLGERSCRIRRHMFFFTPPGMRGTKSQKCGRSWRRRFDCLKAASGVASKVVGQRRPYALVRIAYGGRHGTHGTVPARRGDIGDSERTRVLGGHPLKGDSQARAGQRG